MNTSTIPNVKKDTKEIQEPYLGPKYKEKHWFIKYFWEIFISFTGLVIIYFFFKCFSGCCIWLIDNI